MSQWKRVGIGALAAALIAMCGLLIGCEDAASARDDHIIKIGTVLPETHPTAESLAFLARKLEEVSSGQMRVKVYYNSELGNPSEMLEMLQDGTLQMAQVSCADLTNMAYIANVLAMPFLFRDTDHRFKALDGEVGDAITQELDMYAIRLLGFLDAGTRNITTKQGPIVSPSDMEGLAIRVIDAPLMIETINALGGRAVPMDQGDVYAALQKGTIDGWENNPMTIMSFKMYETGCKYFAWTRHFAIPDVLVAGKPFLRSLTAQQYLWLEEATEEAVARQRKLWQASEDRTVEWMEEAGMLLNDVDIDVWRERVKPVYDKYLERYGEQFGKLLAKIQALE